MTSRCQKVTEATALLLVLSVLHVSVRGNLAGQVPSVSRTAVDTVTQGGDRVSGQLKTRLNRPILVNGVNANAATPIPPGAQIQTPAGVGASVLLASLGQLDIAPNTELTLTFDKGSVDVNLITGCVVLTTNPGINGSVRWRETTERTDRAKHFSLDICAGEAGSSSPIVNQGAAVKANAGAEDLGGAGAGAAAEKGGISGTTIAVIVAAIGGGIGAAVGAAGGHGGGGGGGGANPSPSAPPGSG